MINACRLAIGGLFATVALQAFAQPSIADTGALQARLAALDTEEVILRYAARPGACGNGRHMYLVDDNGGDWPGRCRQGPVQLRIRLDETGVASLRKSIYSAVPGRTDATATDIGEIPATAASTWLLELATTARVSVAEDAIAAAMFADAPDPWRELLVLVEDDTIAQPVRRHAIHWLGRSAARAATRNLAAIAESDFETTEMQKAAVFALSRRHEPERGDMLLRIATTHRNPEVVASAFFWLAESPDERALRLFEEVLVAEAK